MADLSRIVSVVQITSVRLCRAHCRSAVRPVEIAETIEVTPSYEAVVVEKPGDHGSLLVEVTFSLEVHNASGEKELQAEIRGTFELSYRVPDDEEFSSEEFEAFAQVNAVFNAWPYWREFVQTSLTRMDMPVLTVPVFRISRPQAAKNEERDDE